jgi:hypothetical protein
MSNQVNHHRAANQKNKRHNERPVPAGSCGGEGHNGQIGRSVWKKLSRRNERRAIKENRLPRIHKYIKKTATVGRHSTMISGIECKSSGVRCKSFVPRPKIYDTGEE